MCSYAYEYSYVGAGKQLCAPATEGSATVPVHEGRLCSTGSSAPRQPPALAEHQTPVCRDGAQGLQPFSTFCRAEENVTHILQFLSWQSVSWGFWL